MNVEHDARLRQFAEPIEALGHIRDLYDESV